MPIINSLSPRAWDDDLEKTPTITVFACPRRTIDETIKKGKRRGETRSVDITPGGGHHLFELDDAVGTECPGWKLDKAKAQRLYMWPCGPRTRNTFKHPILRSLIKLQFEHDVGDGWNTDVYDGDLYQVPLELGHRAHITNLPTRIATAHCRIW